METGVNNKCKAFTSLEQSKKLAEILPIESADMCWTPFDEKWDAYLGAPNPDAIKKEIPCWSLASLLNVINKTYYVTLLHDGVMWNILVIHHDIDKCNHTIHADSPVDACVAMIELLHKQKLL